jgi:hypothetical protein
MKTKPMTVCQILPEKLAAILFLREFKEIGDVMVTLDQ